VASASASGLFKREKGSERWRGSISGGASPEAVGIGQPGGTLACSLMCLARVAEERVTGEAMSLVGGEKK
jgi:hypothetical protein